MPILPKRYQRLKEVLDKRMSDLTILIEHVEKPHNLSAILRTCDAIGVLEAHAVCKEEKIMTFNSTAQGSQKWVKLNNHPNIEIAIEKLNKKGFKLYATSIGKESLNYLDYDFTGPTAFVLGAEKWGLSKEAIQLIDSEICIPMRGMVQSLNVSVAAAILLFEALRQRNAAGIEPNLGEGLDPEKYKRTIFEWAYPEVASWCNKEGRSYPEINESGEIIENIPRYLKLHY